MPEVYTIDGIVPVVDPSAFVHPSAVLIGDVIVAARAYIGPCASLRGDFGRIVVEEGANIQDHCGRRVRGRPRGHPARLRRSPRRARSRPASRRACCASFQQTRSAGSMATCCFTRAQSYNGKTIPARQGTRRSSPRSTVSTQM